MFPPDGPAVKRAGATRAGRTIISPVIARRSCLSVPATQPRFFEKADLSAADFVFFDLEDSVAPSAKERARTLAVEALRTYEFRGKSRGVRVKACDTRWCFDDVRTV